MRNIIELIAWTAILVAVIMSAGCNFGFGEKSSESAYGSGDDGFGVVIDRDDDQSDDNVEDTGLDNDVDDVEDGVSDTEDAVDDTEDSDTDDIIIAGGEDTGAEPSPYPDWCATDADIDDDGDDSCQCGGIDTDDDNDGYIADACGGDDCDDGFNGTNPGVDEYIGDSQDNDCDGDVDEDDSVSDTGDIIIAGGEDTGDTASPSPYPDWCATDGDIDGDGDDSCQCGGVDLDDDDDGYDADACGGDDCNDGWAGTNPGVDEWPSDGEDNDCDGDIDEVDAVDTGDAGVGDTGDTGAPAPADSLTVIFDEDVVSVELWVGSESIGWDAYMDESTVPAFAELSMVLGYEYTIPIPASWNGSDDLKINGYVNGDSLTYFVFGYDTDGDLINDTLDVYGTVMLNGMDCVTEMYGEGGDYVCR